MWSKFTNIFKKKEIRFKETIKKEKRRFYMFNKKKSSNFKCRRKRKKIFQLKINFNFNKKLILKVSFFGILIALIWILYILKWAYFSIKHINIKINDTITDENIAYKSIDNIRNKSIFLENNEDISKKLLDYQKNINNIEIDRILPNTLNISIDSFPIIMDVYNSFRLYSLTANWVLIPYRVINEDKNRIVINVIKSKENKYKILSYKKFFKVEIINKIYSLVNSFKDNILKHKIERIDFYINEKELHIKTKNNTIFIFSLDEDTNKQLKKLIVFSKEKDKILKYVYIDLRVEDKIFTCPYTKEYQCLKNYRRIYEKKQ